MIAHFKFIFIKRTSIHVYNSVLKQDENSVRGMIDKSAYFTLAANLNKGFEKFREDNNNACIIQYENLVKNADVALDPVWEVLNVKALTGLGSKMRKPENWSG